MSDYWSRIVSKIPLDNTDQYTAQMLAIQIIAGRRGLKVLDLGCGDGRAVDFFRNMDLDVEYYGVDIEMSPEVSQRIRADVSFDTFDGINLPYLDASFDVVYSNQVFEHVENPAALLRQIARVLKPNGHFLGSVSQLEPYHSYSLWNYTLYGWDRLLQSNGLIVTELRPGIDGLTLIMRSIDGRKGRFARFFTESSPINSRIQRRGEQAGLSTQKINHRKIVYSGHLCWVAQPAPVEKKTTVDLGLVPSR